VRFVQAADDARRRIGRDLHDGVQQRLVSLGLWLQAAERSLPGDPAEALELIGQARQQLAEANEELRTVARGLHPSGLAEQGLRGALQSLAAGSPLPIQLGDLPDRRLPEPIEVTAYFLAREGLSNAVKYANAGEVAVDVCDEGGRVRILVADDGAGGATLSVGSGLQGLADRIEALGGTLEVDSPPGGGTRLTAVIPLMTWRTPREPFLEYGYVGDDGYGERSIAEVRAGTRRVSISLVREWDLEGGPPRPGTVLPVRDHEGHTRARVQVERSAVVAFGALDETFVNIEEAGFPSVEAFRANHRRLFDAVAETTAALLSEPGWRLTDAEPVLILWFHLVDTEVDSRESG
jgi:uncharacterized protein YhfF/two-component sensor histidine kinase